MLDVAYLYICTEHADIYVCPCVRNLVHVWPQALCHSHRCAARGLTCAIDPHYSDQDNEFAAFGSFGGPRFCQAFCLLGSIKHIRDCLWFVAIYDTRVFGER